MLDPYILQELTCSCSNTWHSIVLLEYVICCTICIQRINKRKENFINDIYIDVFNDYTINESNGTKLVINKEFLNHLWHTAVFSIALYIFNIIFFLFILRLVTHCILIRPCHSFQSSLLCCQCALTHFKCHTVCPFFNSGYLIIFYFWIPASHNHCWK